MIACAIFAAKSIRVLMKRVIGFIFSGRFWLNILLIVIVIFLLIQATLFWLRSYTRHAESVEVPNLTGYTIAALNDLLINTDLTFEITDSIYSEDFPRGVVIIQNPLAGKKVKEGRTIFISVNSTLPEMVQMPDLYGKSRRIAIPILEISGLKAGGITYKPDPSCTDCVIDQLHNGVSIKAGDRIRKGQEVMLVLGQQSSEMTEVPYLVGGSYALAVEMLMANSLNIGQVLACEGCFTATDTTKAFVIRQMPREGSRASLGSFIDVYLSTDSTMVSSYEAEPDSL